MTPLSRPTPRQARIQLISEGVIASYIHDISTRTAPGANSAIAHRHGSQVHRRAARLPHARTALRGHDARSRERSELRSNAGADRVSAPASNRRARQLEAS